MPRPKKKREICFIPKSQLFIPKNEMNKCVNLTLDEFETIRLIDYEGLTQEECAKQMNVARTTVQSIYKSARKVIADAIVNSRGIEINGGDVILCARDHCGKCIKECPRRKTNKEFMEVVKMIIAVTYEEGNVFQHFGHSEEFKIYEVDNGIVINSYVVKTEGQGHGALAGFLKEKKVDTLVCGGIGGGAINALDSMGITVFPGVSGNTDVVIGKLLSGELEPDIEPTCDHHGEAGCGEHGCKSQSEHKCSCH